MARAICGVQLKGRKSKGHEAEIQQLVCARSVRFADQSVGINQNDTVWRRICPPSLARGTIGLKHSSLY